MLNFASESTALPERGQTSSEGVLHYPREKMVEVVQYLDDVLPQFESLQYEIERELEWVDFSDELEDALPMSFFVLGRTALVKDIWESLQLFFSFIKRNQVELQLKVINTDACRLFHVDNVGFRFLCTYRGPGTEWLDDSNVRRKGLGKGDNCKVVLDFNLINRVSEFDHLILKGGKLWSAVIKLDS